MTKFSKLGSVAGVIAAASMAATPAHAAEIVPTGTAGYATAIHADFNEGGAFDLSTYDEQAETAEYRRRYRGRRYRRGRVRGGDILAGVLILGGIAAVASAASNNNRRDRENRRYEERRDDRRYDDRRVQRRSSDGSGIDNAVSQCRSAIERDVRVDSIDNASRLAEGWVVTGTLFNGSGFSCQIGNDGRISDINYGGDFSGSLGQAEDNQWSDTRYSRARADAGYTQPDRAAQRDLPDQARADVPSGPQPAYPGGPLPGEEFPE